MTGDNLAYKHGPTTRTIYCQTINNSMTSHITHDAEQVDHFWHDVIHGLFLLFVICTLFFHCYLKRREKKIVEERMGI